jgi:hypothetical protein
VNPIRDKISPAIVAVFSSLRGEEKRRDIAERDIAEKRKKKHSSSRFPSPARKF